MGVGVNVGGCVGGPSNPQLTVAPKHGPATVTTRLQLISSVKVSSKTLTSESVNNAVWNGPIGPDPL